MFFKNLYFKLDFSIDSILVLLIISALIIDFGPFLSDLSISLITILFLYKSFKLKLYQYYRANFLCTLYFIYIFY